MALASVSEFPLPPGEGKGIEEEARGQERGQVLQSYIFLLPFQSGF
jgi:hypothetical protein